jgi:hypothetical protein
MTTHERQLSNLEKNIQDEKDDTDQRMKEQLQERNSDHRRTR